MIVTAVDYWEWSPLTALSAVALALAITVGSFVYGRRLPSEELQGLSLVVIWTAALGVAGGSLMIPSIIGGDPAGVAGVLTHTICAASAGIPIEAVGIAAAATLVLRDAAANPGRRDMSTSVRCLMAGRKQQRSK